MEKLSLQTKLVLGIQHVLAMFGATVLVPFLTGLNPSIALICAGVGTLIFHSVTKGIVPVFLGSSFAFIGATALVFKEQGIAILKGGIISAGLVYVLMSFIVLKFGVERIKSFFPPVVVGPIIMVIGLRLSPVALSMAGYSNNSFDKDSLIIALVVVVTMISISILKKSFFRLVPILISVVIGYIVAYFMGDVDLSKVHEASWLGLPTGAFETITTLPKFTFTGVIALAPIALVVFIEHIGDITTNGAVVGKDFFKDPGVHRTLLGDGLATMAAGFLGGPANTTYGENTGVIGMTRIASVSVIRNAAFIAIALSFLGKFTALISTIPNAVLGGMSILLYGVIASNGLKVLIKERVDFGQMRNLIIASAMLVLGLGGAILKLGPVTLSGTALSAMTGILLNLILPYENKD